MEEKKKKGLTNAKKRAAREPLIPKPHNPKRLFMTHAEAVEDNKRIKAGRDKMAALRKELSITTEQRQESASNQLAEASKVESPDKPKNNPLPRKQSDNVEK